MKRRPGWKAPPAPWRAVRDGAGQWVVVSANGEQPLRSSDPMERITAVHLAAAAPELRFLLERLAHRLETLLDEDWTWRKDERLVQGAWGVLIKSKPPYEAVAEIHRQRAQTELTFEESA